MSRTVRKIQKKNSEPKSTLSKLEVPPAPQSDNPAVNHGQLLRKLCEAEIARQDLLHKIDDDILDTIKALLNSSTVALNVEKNLQQKLQQTRHELQTARDELESAQAQLRQVQTEKLKLEQSLQWTRVELKTTKDDLSAAREELHHAEEKGALEAEIERLEHDISYFEQKLEKHPEARERYEARLTVAKEAYARCRERLKQLQRGHVAENFTHDSPFDFLDEESNRKFWQQVNLSEPLDEVIIRSQSDEQKLLAIWGAVDNDKPVPSEIISTGTMPLENLKITFTTENFSARVMFFNCPDKEFFQTGVIIFELKTINAKLAYFFAADNDSIVLTSRLGLSGIKFTVEETKKFLPVANKVLRVWYGIEVALLNPIVKEQISTRHLEPVDGQGENLSENVVTYIKRVPITVDELIAAVESRKIDWRVDKWGVTGHWRKYSTGKMVWVRPYEKGRKRGQKLNQEPRERIIVPTGTAQVAAQ